MEKFTEKATYKDDVQRVMKDLEVTVKGGDY